MNPAERLTPGATSSSGTPVRTRRRLLCGLLLVPLSLVVLRGRAAPDLDRMLHLAEQRYDAAAVRRVRAWRELLESLQDSDTPTRLRQVNRFFNRAIRWRDDIDIWGEQDYWASPLETLGKGAGDCEDFTIAKYMSLRLLGLSDEQMRLIYVRARIGGRSQAHMVLGYYETPGAEPQLLDNLIGEIRPARRRPDLEPVFSFNGSGLWVGESRQSRADPEARLSRWRRVLERMQVEGLR